MASKRKHLNNVKKQKRDKSARKNQENSAVSGAAFSLKSEEEVPDQTSKGSSFSKEDSSRTKSVWNSEENCLDSDGEEFSFNSSKQSAARISLEFLERIKEMIPDEADAFIQSLDYPMYQGLRLNPKKNIESLKEALDRSQLKKSPFSDQAWYIHGSYGLYPEHLQGLYYLQEPSAASAVEILDVQPGDCVLDLCAAPGGKSTQIASKLQDGFLLSNEYDGQRALSLLSNMERMGVENFAVVNMDTGKLCRQFNGCFDRILVDAPCSGEGMIKKHSKALEEWSLSNIRTCSNRQQEILANAYQALKPGGVLVYSTCTYAREENEETAAWFLKNFPDMKQAEIHADFGRTGLLAAGLDETKVRRIFPMDFGEGHFIAKFIKEDKTETDEEQFRYLKSDQLPAPVRVFLQEQMEQPFAYYMEKKLPDRVQFFGMNHPFLDLKNCKTLRQGVYIGDLVKNRFEPAHAFFMSQSMQNSKTKTDVSLKEMDDFVHGLQLGIKADKGYRTLCYQGVPFGFGKSDGTRITNKYPKGLRLKPGSHLKASLAADLDLKQQPLPA